MSTETGWEERNPDGGPKERFVERVREAIKTGDGLPLIESLCELNGLLTGIEGADFNSTEMGRRQLQEKVDNFISEAREDPTVEAFYLGDSGLSRLIISVDGDTILVGTAVNSTSAVRAKWDTLDWPLIRTSL